MLVAGIKSRPVYPGLKADLQAKHNLLLADAEGAMAVLDMLASVPADFAVRSTILYVPSSSVTPGYTERLKAITTAGTWTFPTLQTAMFRFNAVLPTMTMGTRIYVAGTEPFIGSAVQTAMAHGINHHSILTEHRGSEVRRVQCVHCKGFTEDVATNWCECAHCGIKLLVRDHYSRRLGAFQGVSIDAEAPGQVPAQEIVFK
jgi:dimethylamine monooxygenase subunit C